VTESPPNTVLLLRGSIGACLTLIDLVAIAGLFLTTAFFYPAMAWLLLLSWSG